MNAIARILLIILVWCGLALVVALLVERHERLGDDELPQRIRRGGGL